MTASNETRLVRAAMLATALALAGCASPPPPVPEPAPVPSPAAAAAPVPTRPPSSAAVPHYRCDHEIEFTVRFQDGAALVDAGPRGIDTLLRDAGGVTPQQTVYSSTRLRVEFGLGANGREAVLHYLTPPLEARCMRQ